MFYSKFTNGFYDAAIHGGNIPVDAVAVTKAEHAALLAAQSIGKRIQPNINGNPVALDKTQAEMDAEATAKAKAELARLDAQSIRALREFILSKFPADPLLPPVLPAYESAAVTERAKIK